MKDHLYRLYLEAGTPPVKSMASAIGLDDSFPGSPSKATVHRIIAADELAAGQEDVVSVAMLLARMAGADAVEAGRRIKQMWVAAHLAEPLGVPVAGLDPFALEVHPAITVPGQQSLPALPVYVERAHDRELNEAVERAGRGESVMVTLVGESSTGKTRTCWEALRRLPEGWRVWHPYDPSRPDAALHRIREVSPRTVVWLNEAQHYLLAQDPKTAERVAAALRTALTDRGRSPVLVLATVWPRFWDPLTAPSATGSDDRFAQQRELLTGIGSHIVVPKAFTSHDIEQAWRQADGDPRLESALIGATDGEITQFLAGVPRLMARYRTAPSGAMALIHAAMDYRRLGHGPSLRHDLLVSAAEGYLTDRELAQLGPDWAAEGLAFCAEPCYGVLGPLTRIPYRGDDAGEPAYRLADYLEQQGRLERRLICPPATFWQAAVGHCTNSDDYAALGIAAETRGRLRSAAELYQRAVTEGNTEVLLRLARLREGVRDTDGAKRLYAEAYRHDKVARWELVRLWSHAGHFANAEDLAVHAAQQGNTSCLIKLSQLWLDSGDEQGAARLRGRAAHRGGYSTFAELARTREAAGERRAAEAFAFESLEAGSTYALSELVRAREKSGCHAEDLVARATKKGRVRPGLMLARARERSGDTLRAERLLVQAAESGSVFALVEHARLRRKAGDLPRAESLLRRAVEQGSTVALIELARLREKAGDPRDALHLFRTAASRNNADALAALALFREQSGASAEAEAMACRAADAGSTFALVELVWRREQTRDRAGAERLADTALRAGNAGALVLLARLREKEGDAAEADRLVLRAARSGNRYALNEFVRRRESAGDPEGAERLALAGGGRALAQLARLREESGSALEAERLYHLAVDRGEAAAVGELVRLKEAAGFQERAHAYALRAARAGHVDALAVLAALRADSGALEDADRLYRAAADAGVHDALRRLAELQRRRDPGSEDLWRYGLAPDGSTSPPWGADRGHAAGPHPPDIRSPQDPPR
ncbi:transcriptional regulator [Streptomyces sp. NPDC007002]|uniref:transcriptional regulator n=1 Tax=Streptomyces sp. NPDC007002 TaxID=3156910 RepID=UPI0034521E4E